MSSGQGRTIEQLLAVDPAECSRDELFDRLIELDALASRVQARRERFLAAAHDPDDRKQWVREEVACALRWSIGFAEARIAQAVQLVTKLPLILELHETGAIGEAHARAAAEASFGLTDEVVAAVQDRVLERAPEQTVTQFRAALRRAVARADTRAAEDKHQAAKAERLVRLSPLPDGMAGIWSVHTAVDAEAIHARLSEHARQAQQADQATGQTTCGSMAAYRADALRDLVLGFVPTRAGAGRTGRNARVQVLVPQAVAAGDSDAPGELAGYGPIPAALCREVLADPTTRVEKIIVDTAGRVLPIGVIECPTRRTPTSSQTRWVTARFPTCRFPGCNRRAVGCEIDHIIDYDGTNTVIDNLEPLCARHHHLKHEAPGWMVWPDADGISQWRSPHWRVYPKPADELPTADP